MVLRISRWSRHMRRRFGAAAGRTTRRMFRPTRRAKQRWSMRRFIRRPMKSELKWSITTAGAATDVASNTFNTSGNQPSSYGSRCW